jgi:hypothetical protein
MQGLPIDHLLRVTISAFIVLATMLLGLGENSATLTLVSLAMTVVSGYVSHFKGWYRLRQSMADWVALGVVVVAAANAYQLDRAGQMLVLAHLQSYLQYVLLFQPRTARIYWQLAVLSLGQVAIASTLVSGPIFAVMLLAYLFVGIFTFILLLLDVEARHFSSKSLSEYRLGEGDSPNLLRGLRKIGTVPDGSRIGPKAADEWAGEGVLTIERDEQPRRAPILFGNSAALDPGPIYFGVIWQTAFLCLFAVSVGAALFFVLPRRDVQRREVASTEPLRSVGFSKTVTLGELGEVVNNPDVVMRIEFFRGRESRPFKLIGEPLFRGTVVVRYANGTWTQPDRKGVVVLPGELRSPFVRQRITVEPMDVAELFCVFPVFALQPDFRLRVDPANDQLIRQEDYRSLKVEVEVGTNGIVDDRQRKMVPCESRLSNVDIKHLLETESVGVGTNDPLAGLRASAAGILQDRQIVPGDRLVAARALSDHFSSSGRYLYSLEPQPRDATLDPLEDFVTKHPLGHCEYFAGALVMMLRSQGIPARMAIGFKGGEWNPLGMYYQVQQLHAHAWVEVYLAPGDIPPGEFVEDEAPNGAWLVLDPTEGTQQSNSALLRGGILARLHQYIDYAQVLWTNYVVGLNSKRQRQGIYEPFAQGVSAAVENVVSREVWQDRFHDVSNSSLGTFWEWYRLHWFSWRGGLVAAGFSLIALSPYLIVRWLLRALRRLGLVGAGRFGDEPPVLEMYRRLEKALAGRGLSRHPAQTAHEFAVSAGGELAEHVEYRRVAHLPRRIIDVFHRVRFGGRTLDNVEADAVEHALAELERGLAGFRPKAAPKSAPSP